MNKEKINSIIETPWDSKVFGFPTYEIQEISEAAFKETAQMRGHFTVRVEPMTSKKMLHEHGFYYCDTLIQPFCKIDGFKYFEHIGVSISRSVPLDQLIPISDGAFRGRYHRDFNMGTHLADLRYNSWLEELYLAGHVVSLMFQGELAGFWGCQGNKIVLHAMAESHRGKGLAKYLWSAVCSDLFHQGHEELSSSISFSNVPALNLYSSLGFKFRNPVDVYHKFNKESLS